MKPLLRLLVRLIGDPRLDPLSARLFNSVSIVNGVLNLLGSFAALTLPDPVRLFLLHFISGSLFLLYYFISRFRSQHRSLFWLFNLTILVFLSFNWFWNGGSVGGAHYYFIPALVIATILLDGRRPYLIYGISLLVVGSLFAIEYLYPEWITMYPSREDRLMDAGGNYLFVQLLTGILIFILTNSLEFERLKSDRLLRNILPLTVAEELKKRDRVTPRGYSSATVLFADLTGFTAASADLNPEQLIKELDQLFASFDHAVRATGLEKIKTIGDAYMAAGGIPDENQTHSVDAVLCALRFQKLMKRHSTASEPARNWRLRVGIHCGPVITGVVGTDKFVYDVWGDTVNTASRMEAAGLPGEVNISKDMYERVKDFFICEGRGLLPVKGKGDMEMFLVKGIRPELEDRPNHPNAEFKALYARLKGL